MTRGERIAWIWVWSAMGVVALIAVFAVWRYWTLPLIYLSSLQCNGSDLAVARAACERVLTYERATVEMQAAAHLRLGNMAKHDGKHEIAVDHYSALISLDRATADDWNERGLNYYSLQRYDKAAEDFRQAATINGAEGIYWSNLADAELVLKKHSEAYDHYTTAIENGDDTAEVLGNRGWASYQLGNYEKALADYVQAIAQDGQHADNLNERGLVRHALGEYENALSDYDRSLALRPDNAVILTNRAITYARIGNAERAEQDLDRAIALDPKYSLAHLEKAWLLINQNRPEAALAELKVMEGIGPLDLSALEARSRALLDLFDWQGAIADADRALSQGSTYDWPYEHRARAKRGLGEYDGSIADATVLISRNPKNMSRLVTRAITLHLAGRTDAALADMSQAISEDNDPAYAYEMKSYFNLGLGRVKEAVADAQQSVALASGSQSQHSTAMLGWALLEDQDPTAAIETCTKSLAIELTTGAYACRALAHLALKRPDAATADAHRAVDLGEHDSAGHFALGRIDLAEGRAAEAVKRFDLALKFAVFNPAEILMYRGDAERALGDFGKARLDYQEARKRDRGRYREALDERLGAVAAQ